MNDRLDGCIEKVKRADEQIRDLNREISIFLDNYRLTSKPHEDGKPGSVILCVDAPKLPLRFSVISGEIVHNLRTSLDHLVGALVIANGNTPTDHNSFPVCLTAKKFKEARDGGKIKGISAGALALIKSLQPYCEARPEHHPLWILHEMSLTDKHRLLLVLASMVATLRFTAGNAQEGFIEAEAGGREMSAIRLTEGTTEILGVQLGVKLPVNVEGKSIAQITFEKFGMAEREPIIPALLQLRDATFKAVELFRSEF